MEKKWVRAIQSEENRHDVAVLKMRDEKFRNVMVLLNFFLAILFKNGITQLLDNVHVRGRKQQRDWGGTCRRRPAQPSLLAGLYIGQHKWGDHTKP